MEKKALEKTGEEGKAKNKGGARRRMSRRSLSENDLLVSIEAMAREAQQQRAHDPHASLANAMEQSDTSFANYTTVLHQQSFRNDEENGKDTVGTETTARLKDHTRGDEYRNNRAPIRQNRLPNARMLGDVGRYDSLRTQLSDDGMEYYKRLAGAMESLRRPSQREQIVPKIFRRHTAPHEVEPPPPPTFMVEKRQRTPISEWDLTSSSGEGADGGSVTGELPRGRNSQVSLQREQLTDSLLWFSYHTPRCVLEDLTFHEVEECGDVIQIDVHNNNNNNAPPSAPAAASGVRRTGRRKSIGNRSLGADDSDSASLSSLSDDEPSEARKSRPRRNSVGFKKQEHHEEEPIAVPLAQRLLQNTLNIPHNTKRESALVFVDISGFTKLSMILDVESLSKVINTYFRMMVGEVVKYGGDILKFAGDAFFAEWRVKTEDDVDMERIRQMQNHPLTNFRTSFMTVDGDRSHVMEERTLADCVMAACQCAASMVEQYSDFHVQTARDLSISFGKEQQGKTDAMLNVHCGVGCGTLVGLHVGDPIYDGDEVLETRREFLFLGDPIDQVSLAESKASEGEVYASPQAVKLLRQRCEVSVDAAENEPACVAARDKKFFVCKDSKRMSTATAPPQALKRRQSICESIERQCAEMNELTLARLHRQLSLYVHPVVRDDQLDVTTSQHGVPTFRSRELSTNRHRAEAELRSVYTMFINAKIEATISGDNEKDSALFNKLQRIMQVTCRELHTRSGQLRQFIVDDKGIVLIATFGLRGSTFANMVTNHALPATFAVHRALNAELNVENRIGATFGKAYCGVVGGIRRHEFAVMGAPVNLAARLMHSKFNNGILVDEAIQAHADSRFAFKRLTPVTAKGYDKPVIIFEPLHAVNTKKRGVSHGFIGRTRDVAELADVAKSVLNDLDDSETIMAFIIGESGMGKTALGLCVHEEMKLYAGLHHKKIIFSRSTSTETEQRIPLSSFRKVFLGAIRELCVQDGTLPNQADDGIFTGQRRSNRRGSIGPAMQTRRMSMSRAQSRRAPKMKLNRVDSLSSMTSARSVNIPYLKRLCEVCEELQYPYEFADIVGSQLLGLEGAVPTTHVDGRVPSIDEVVDFLTSAYIRLTDYAELNIIFLDDFQWIDSFTWKVIRYLCDKGKNMLIMGAMRSQETQSLRRMSSVASWHGTMQSRSGIVEVNIGPLENEEVRELVSKVLGFEVNAIDEQLGNDIYQRTGGLPIYVIELLESIKRNKTVAIDEETGIVSWTPEAEREQKRIGSNSVAAIELSFLNRFDSLDLAVRRVLQTCAVLGMSFSLSDVIRVHPELDELVIELSLNAAVDELILVEDVEDDEDDDMSVWSTSDCSRAIENRHVAAASWNAIDDRFFQFSHGMWRKSVLDAMLTEHKVHLHKTIAEAMEKEQVLVMESSDIGRLLTLFDHWKSCGDFGKAAPLALAVGLRLEEWDLSAQSLDLYRDALEMCYESADNPDGAEPTRDENEVWLPASAPPATVEFILRLHIRIAKCHAHLGEQEQCANMFEDAYKIMTTSPKAAKLNQELVLPIISGLCSVAIQRNSGDATLLAEKEELVERFVRETRARDDVIHISRALAMKASFFARLGQFENALEIQRELDEVYSVDLHSAGIREEYGKDYAAQSHADSTEWLMLIGDQEAAEQQADIVIDNILPQFDLRDVDTVMEMIFPILLVLKSIGRARDAESILFNNAINPYHDLGGSSSCWLKLFNPIAYLFEINKMIEDGDFDAEMLVEIEDWAMNPERSIFSIDLQYKGYAFIGEICAHLAKFKHANGEDPQELLDRGRMVLTRVVYASNGDESEAFMVMSAKTVLKSIDDMEDLLEEDDSGDGGQMRIAGLQLEQSVASRNNVSPDSLHVATSTPSGDNEDPPNTDAKEMDKCCSIL